VERLDDWEIPVPPVSPLAWQLLERDWLGLYLQSRGKRFEDDWSKESLARETEVVLGRS
jgi:hypothetical protein